ncbi:MAG: hypothetical protein M3R27_07695 [Bacteroidota bacterium]|nr:hypothetical protein [Bacteroidota bacterium]
MIRKILTVLIIFCLSFSASSQETKDDLSRLKAGEDLNVQYRNEGSFGIYVHTNAGIGLAYRRGYMVHAKRKRMFELEAQNFKHPKEIKSVNSFYEDSKGFVYGKLNSIFLIRPGVGIQNIIYQKSDKKSVEIRFSYYIGAALAFAKPVYLEIIRPTNDPFVPYTISSERYDPEIHYADQIYGKAPFLKGLDKTRIHPGGYAKLALSFEYADRYNGIKAIETGVVLDVYPTVIPIMAYNKHQQVFASLYLKMIWGKKWF